MERFSALQGWSAELGRRILPGREGGAAAGGYCDGRGGAHRNSLP